MSAVWSSTWHGHSGATAGTLSSLQPQPLATLVYRSHATEPLPERELDAMILAAQARNRAESITGLLIHDDGCYFQWLEGPAAGLSRVWQSIRDDPRHTGIEIVGDAPTPVRFFADWSLKLAQRPGAGALSGSAVDLPSDLMDARYRQADAARALFAELAPRPSTMVVAAPALDLRQQALLKGVVESVAIPRLIAKHSLARKELPPAHPRAAELAGLLIAADPTEAFALIEGLQATAVSMGSLFASVLEPSARRLGDLWSADDCSESDVTIGMCRMQSALRASKGFSQPWLTADEHGTGVVLVVPQPGELHILGSSLDAEVLLRAGWETHCEFPATDEALQDLLADTWFDTLDLSLSAAFRHEHRLARMAKTIRHARRASRNPGLRVVVGGRAFFEEADAGHKVGADAASASSMQVGALAVNPAS